MFQNHRQYLLISILQLGLAAAWGVASAAVDGDPVESIGIEEKLGQRVELETQFLDASGRAVQFGELVDKPTILTLVYFHCPTICKPLLGALSETVAKTELTPGVDYNLVTVSFDEMDSPTTAATAKNNFVHALGDEPAPNAWRFLTGDSAAIAALTESVGFSVKRQEADFAHGAALIVLSKDGTIVRYLYGLDYLPFDIKMAVAEAEKGIAVPSIAKVLRYCFSYDPEGRQYVFNVTRVAGAGIILIAVGYVFFISTIGRFRKTKVSG